MKDEVLNYNNRDEKNYDLLSFDFLLSRVSKNINIKESDEKLLRKGYDTAVKYHSSQLRNSGEPYVNHCIWTAIYISEQKLDIETIVSGLLHDSIEDTTYTEDLLKNDFGNTIYNLVMGVTKISGLKYHGLERHAESLRKFIISMSEDVRVVVIKLCDRLHNIKSIKFVREEKRKRIALETIEIYARLADRLGMGKLKSELEDTAFPFVDEDAYQKTLQILNEIQTADNSTLEKISNNLKEELKIFDVHIESVDYRVKRLYSLWKKLNKYKYDTSKINDLLAIRIIVPETNDCYIALGIVHGLYKPKPGRFKDYISNPKINGYQSLHTTIFTGDGHTIDIQIRSKRMNEEAEYGVYSHINYKESNNRGMEIKWANALLDWQKDINNNGDFLKTVKEDFLNKRIFVFTPKGDIMDMPEGATTLDFAYSVHTDIGNQTYQTYVNNKLVPIHHKLNNHDIIKIETKNTAKPNRKWLNYVITHHAKKQITNWLKEHGGLIDKLFIK